MYETLDLDDLCEQCDLSPCECEDWIMKNDWPEMVDLVSVELTEPHDSIE
jgi:hypothetical protein|tara:strand:+ start:666 stop:815 length:150 start_codon:yes stop_codon:yes gene_type:complete